jgi:FkbH-like protein
MYAAQKQRAGAEQNFQSKEDFFRFLEQEAELEPVSELRLARVAQLTQKTNQFNLTTRRYTEPQIAEMAKQPDWHIFSIKVRDRFGDHGLVGVAIAHDQGEQCEVDTFLLSCRVIGRTVETALLAHLAESARRRGCKRLFADEEKCTGARFLRAAWFRAAEDGWHGLFVGIRSGEFYSAQPRLD